MLLPFVGLELALVAWLVSAVVLCVGVCIYGR